MEILENLSKRGWRFAIWLSESGCIIQGKIEESLDDSNDWQFDVKASSFDEACILAMRQITGIKVDSLAANGKG